MVSKSILVKIHKDSNVSSGFANSAVDAIHFHLDPVVNFNIDAEVYGNCNTLGQTWGEVQNEFEDYLGSELIEYEKNTCHLLIVDRFLPMGAGYAWVDVNGGISGYKSGQCVANAATKFYINSSCYGDGGKGYENTVIHEVGHTLGAQHSDGAIGPFSSLVTPMQTWYTDRSCDNNDPVTENCWNNPQAQANGYQGTLTTCAKNKMETYVSNNYL